MKINILEIDGRPATDGSGNATAKVTFTSGDSSVPQTLFSPWDDVKDLEPGSSYPVTFGAALPVVQPTTGTATETAEPAQGTEGKPGEGEE